jgi:hypothetical protein
MQLQAVLYYTYICDIIFIRQFFNKNSIKVSPPNETLWVCGSASAWLLCDFLIIKPHINFVNTNLY